MSDASPPTGTPTPAAPAMPAPSRLAHSHAGESPRTGPAFLSAGIMLAIMAAWIRAGFDPPPGAAALIVCLAAFACLAWGTVRILGKGSASDLGRVRRGGLDRDAWRRRLARLGIRARFAGTGGGPGDLRHPRLRRRRRLGRRFAARSAAELAAHADRAVRPRLRGPGGGHLPASRPPIGNAYWPEQSRPVPWRLRAPLRSGLALRDDESDRRIPDDVLRGPRFRARFDPDALRPVPRRARLVDAWRGAVARLDRRLRARGGPGAHLHQPDSGSRPRREQFGRPAVDLRLRHHLLRHPGIRDPGRLQRLRLPDRQLHDGMEQDARPDVLEHGVEEPAGRARQEGRSLRADVAAELPVSEDEDDARQRRRVRAVEVRGHPHQSRQLARRAQEVRRPRQPVQGDRLRRRPRRPGAEPRRPARLRPDAGTIRTCRCRMP